MILRLFLTIFVLGHIFNATAFAQVCGPAFEDIDIACIKKLDGKLKEQLAKHEKVEADLKIEKENPKSTIIKKLELANKLIFYFDEPDKLEEKINEVYFYRTSAGKYGKFIIKHISQTKNSCSMYIEAVTFNKKGTFTKSPTLSINNEANSWSVDRTSLDEALGTDFVLKREFGICVFKRVHGNAVLAKKIVTEEEESENVVLYYAAQFLIGLAVFLVARTVFQDEDRFQAQSKLEDAEQETKQEKPKDFVLKYSRPFFKRYFTPVIRGMKNKRKIKEKYKRPLASSGMNKFLTPEDFYAFKLFLIIGFPIVFLGLREFLEESWPLSYVPVVSILGFFYPDIWIKGKIEQRRTNVLENMPFVVDMLALSVEAGLDFVAAMQKVIEKAPPSALVEEFEILIKETRVGASRAEALRQLSWRIDALPISSFCATLIAADSVGANIAPILKTLAKELREKRSALIEKKGAQAATKILIPMIFFVLPAVLIIIAAPIALQLMGN